MSDSRKAKWKELKAGAAKPVNPELKKLIETPTNPSYGTAHTGKDMVGQEIHAAAGKGWNDVEACPARPDSGDPITDSVIQSLVLDPTIRAENDDLKQQLAQKIGIIDALTATGNLQTVAIGNLRAELDAAKLQLKSLDDIIDKQTAALNTPPEAAPPADAVEAFKSFIFTPAGRDLTDYRIPTEPGRLVGVLEDRARVAFLEGFRIGRGE